MPISDNEWDDNEFPLAYFITFRTYGTWLHGDDRRSVDTHDGKNVYGFPDRDPNKNLRNRMRDNMKGLPVCLDRAQRGIVKEAIKEVCEVRGYRLLALNVRTNHIHVVVSAVKKSETVAGEFKRIATSRLRDNGYFLNGRRIWSRGRSRPPLWKPREVESAIEYVLYRQGDREGTIDIT